MVPALQVGSLDPAVRAFWVIPVHVSVWNKALKSRAALVICVGTLTADELHVLTAMRAYVLDLPWRIISNGTLPHFCQSYVHIEMAVPADRLSQKLTVHPHDWQFSKLVIAAPLS
jgi:hypothetical protein